MPPALWIGGLYGFQAVFGWTLANGVVVADLQVDERDGQEFQAFFVVAPDGLCYYFHQLIS